MENKKIIIGFLSGAFVLAGMVGCTNNAGSSSKASSSESSETSKPRESSENTESSKASESTKAEESSSESSESRSESSESVAEKYACNIAAATGGQVNADKTEAAKDESVTFTVEPDEGFDLIEFTVNGVSHYYDVANGQYTTSMVEGGLEVSAKFSKKETPADLNDSTKLNITEIENKKQENPDEQLVIPVTLGEQEATDLAYFENNTGYTGKGIQLGNTGLVHYGATPAKAGDYKFIFKDGTITSAAKGYESIDIYSDSSVMLLVPGNSDVVFQNMTFNNAISFYNQMFTSPWSYLNSLTFKNCIFNGILIGSSPAYELTFDGCTFNNYINETSANNSNPIWMRSGSGYWGDGYEDSAHSLHKFVFKNNTVTSTRPVKIEYFGLGSTSENNSYSPEAIFLDNHFDIKAQATDTETKVKNDGIYIGTKGSQKITLVDDGNTKTKDTNALYAIAPTFEMASGSKVTDRNGNPKVITDAADWYKAYDGTKTIQSVD